MPAEIYYLLYMSFIWLFIVETSDYLLVNTNKCMYKLIY